MSATDTGGTRDVVYNLISVAYHALQGAETYGIYVQDAHQAGDQEAIAFFEKARDEALATANEAKNLLGQKLSQS
jgi:hypothetical protein